MTKKPKCPCCNEADADYRQEKAPERCAWCGYNNDTGEHAQLVPAADPLDEFFEDDPA